MKEAREKSPPKVAHVATELLVERGHGREERKPEPEELGEQHVEDGDEGDEGVEEVEGDGEEWSEDDHEGEEDIYEGEMSEGAGGEDYASSEAGDTVYVRDAESGGGAGNEQPQSDAAAAAPAVEYQTAPAVPTSTAPTEELVAVATPPRAPKHGVAEEMGAAKAVLTTPKTTPVLGKGPSPHIKSISGRSSSGGVRGKKVSSGRKKRTSGGSASKASGSG